MQETSLILFLQKKPNLDFLTLARMQRGEVTHDSQPISYRPM